MPHIGLATPACLGMDVLRATAASGLEWVVTYVLGSSWSCEGSLPRQLRCSRPVLAHLVVTGMLAKSGRGLLGLDRPLQIALQCSTTLMHLLRNRCSWSTANMGLCRKADMWSPATCVFKVWSTKCGRPRIALETGAAPKRQKCKTHHKTHFLLKMRSTMWSTMRSTTFL